MALVKLPYMYITDPTSDKVAFNAKIYIGNADTNPRIEANQKVAYFVQENGTLIEAPQPIRTNAGGYPVYNGSVVAIDVTGTYSLAIDTSTDSQLYYYASAGEGEQANTTITLDAARLDLGLSYADVGVSLITDQAGTSLNLAKWIVDLDTCLLYTSDAADE